MSLKSSDFQHAYILHTRPYRETSLLVDLLTEQDGRVSAVARGAKRKKSLSKATFQPFVLLAINWFGSSELVTLKQTEVIDSSIRLTGKALLSAFYINELLCKLLHRFDAAQAVFSAYQQVIHQLANLENDSATEAVLRYFEKALLDALGYGLHLTELPDGAKVLADQYYFYGLDGYFSVYGGHCPQTGESSSLSLGPRVFKGSELLGIAQDAFYDKPILQAAKRLMRFAFALLLGEKSLNSRELFVML